MGSSTRASVLRVPSDSVNRRCWVRSSRAERSRRSEMTLTATNSTATATRATSAAVRRDRDLIAASIRFLEIDDEAIGDQERADDREKEHDVAQIDDAADDGVEMRQEAEGGDDAQHSLRRPALQETQHDRRATDGE